MVFAGARPPTRHRRGSRPFPLRAVADTQPPTSGVTRSAVFSLFLVPSFPLVSFLVPLISSLFLPSKNFASASVVNPPLEVAPIAIKTRLAKQTGHMVIYFLSLRRL